MSARRRPARERFALLPRAASDVWQGGLVRLPAWIAPGAGTAPYRPWGALWVSRQSGLLHLKIEPAPESHGPQLLLQALLEFALDRRVGGHRPGRLEVGDDETRAWLTWALRDPELAIETVPGLAAVQEALARLDTFVHGRPPIPGALSGAGVTLARLGAFAEAARRFYAAAPWRWLTDEDLLHVESPVAPRGLGYVTVMGGAGRVYGLSFFDGPDDLEAFLEQEDVEELVGGEGRWSVLFGPITELPLADADLFQRHGWPVAGPEAYPVAVRFGPGPGVQRPDAATLTYLEALLLALAESTETDIDRGRWERRVETAGGPVAVALAIPALLEPLDAPPRPRRGLVDRRAMERFLVEAERFVARSGLEDMAAVQAALQERFAGRRLDELPSTAETPLERAQDVVYRAVESRGRRRVQLARHALELSPDCADAWTLLAEAAPEPGEALELYARAVAAAERALGPEPFTADVGHFWGHVATRPYMRARLGLAQTLEALGRRAEAIAHYQELLRLNPNDNQGVRYLLLPALFLEGQDQEAGQLLERYREDASATWAYGRALWTFRREGASPAARRALRTALRENPHVPRYLLAEAEPPGPLPASFSPRSPEEARVCAEELGEAWRRTPDARAWLRTERAKLSRAPGRRKRRR